MKYHKLLQKQINKHLLERDFCNDPHFQNFIQAINDSYNSFERDKELMDHAFSTSEEEYQEVYQNLHKEYEQKSNSIQKLYDSLKSLDASIEKLPSENLEELTDYFSKEIQKRKGVEEELGKHLGLQKILMNISQEYIKIPFDKINDEIHLSLKEMADFVNADRAYIFRYDFKAGTFSNSHEYCGKGIDPQIQILQDIPISEFPEWVESNLAGKIMHIPDVDALENGNVKDILESQDIKSLLVIPLFQKEECVGFVGFDSVREKHLYTETETELLSLFAKVLANAEIRFNLESNLTRTVELLKTLLANLHYGILVEDENRNILFTNQMLCDMFGVEQTPDQMVGVNCSHIAEGIKGLFKNGEEFVEEVCRVLHDKKLVCNHRLETKDNRFFERDYIPIFLEDQYRGNLWVYNDITTRVISQNRLEQSEERNRLMMESALSAILTVNYDAEVIFWNKMAESIFGWKKEDIIGKKIVDTIIPESYRENLIAGIEKYKQKGEGLILNKQFEAVAERKSGEQFQVEISIIPLEQDGEKFFCTFVQDISNRKQAEQSLKVQEEKYRNIIANMNLGLLEVDNNEVIQYANQSFVDVSGFQLEEIIGNTPDNLFVINSKKNRELIDRQIELRKTGVSSQFRVPIKNKRGELRWWVVSGAPNYDDKGNAIGSIGIHLDITEQIMLEEDLKNEKEKAQEASRAKEAFLANMSHEIRTPLNAIIGFLRELKKQELSQTQETYIENSYTASQHLLSIINNILDISKIDAGEMTVENTEFSLRASVFNVINILKPKSSDSKVFIDAKVSPDIEQFLEGDHIKIEQVLFNLLGNALKFTQEGNITIKCDLLEDNPNKQKVKISVSDTGIGMSKDFVQKIFKKFYQEDETIARKFGGTGLGMAITHELVKLMKGKIEVESEKGKGTTIEVILELKKTLGENLNFQNNTSSIENLNQAKVLVVEDNELNRLLATNTLLNFNCCVTEANDGKQALQILENEEFDIILMDLQMPELDGIQATKIIREIYKINTPIVALTANAFKTEIEKCYAVGMNDYIIKPFTEEVLANTISKILQKDTADDNQNNRENMHQRNHSLYNLDSLRILSRGNEDFVKKMLRIFIEQTEQSIPKIHQYCTAEDFVEIAKLIHKIRPSIDGIGITSISEEIKLLEIEAKENTITKANFETRFAIIESTLKKVVEEVKENELTE